MKRILVILLLCLCIAPLSAQSPRAGERPLSLYTAMSGAVHAGPAQSASVTRLAVAAQAREPAPQPVPVPEVPYKKKSPVLAGAMSLVLPGAGQVYAESYWTAALFATLEAVGWYMVADQNSKGDDATKVFETYADNYWSVATYATWLNTWAKTFPGGEDTEQITISGDESRPPWERVNWAEMNTVEMAIPQFSHRLPPHGDQQYFEMIGKYNQYSSGWEDYDSGQDYYNISPRYNEYSGLRGAANDYYNNADAIVNLIIINHVLAAAEAAWAAARFNKFVDLYSSTRLRHAPDGRVHVEPQLGLAMRF